MAYLLTHFWPGGTEAEYRATVAAATERRGRHAARVVSRRRADGRRVPHRRDVRVQGGLRSLRPGHAPAADADRRRPRRPARRSAARRSSRRACGEEDRARPYPRGVPDPLDGLTPAQREVAAHRGGPLLVVGAAGTGKTRALLARHAWLASAGGLAPEQVLALTASEAAADALRTGVEDELERGFEELGRPHGARLRRAAAARRGARGRARSLRRARSRRPTGSRCCWSASTS